MTLFSYDITWFFFFFLLFLCFVCFFFQAEDGIRDLVRSRGLGDVYKRQGKAIAAAVDPSIEVVVTDGVEENLDGRQVTPFDALTATAATAAVDAALPVSYTPMPLPTGGLGEV